VATYRKVERAECVMGRLGHGGDLLEELTRAAAEVGARAGVVRALGAVRTARLGYYDQSAREYRFFEVEGPHEITSLVGNVSVKDGEVMVHAHVNLADEKGRVTGGHLAPGTVVFACEFVLQVFEGAEFTRELDEETGLPLWKM
jgi:hypothetical protein